MNSIPFRPFRTLRIAAPEKQTIQAVLIGAAVWAALILLAYSAPEAGNLEADTLNTDHTEWVPMRY